MIDKNRFLNGAVHIHSTLSHDGTMPCEQPARFLKDKGYDFAALTEYSCDMSNNSIKELGNRCEIYQSVIL